VAVQGERWRRPWGPGSGAWGGARGSGDRALAQQCSDGKGRWVAAPLGTGVWHVGRGQGEWEPGIGAAVLRWRGAACGSAWGSEGWWVAAQGDQRGGVVVGWCGDWLVVTPEKRNTKSVG
jgi:hypothetical protein